MRAAVALFGIPRRSDIAFPSIERCLLAPLAARCELDVVHHLYRQDSVVNPRTGENHRLPEAAYRPFEAFRGVFEPRPAQPPDLVHRLRPFGDAWGDGLKSLTNLVLQLRSLEQATQLATERQPRIVVFARADLLYHDPITPHDIERAGAHAEELALPCWECWGGYNDRFALAGERAFRHYGERVRKADDFCGLTGKALHSESLLKFALAQAGVPVRFIGQRASRVRADGSVAHEDFGGHLSPLERTGPPGP